MSLSVYLKVEEPVQREGSGIFVRRNGSMVEITREEWDEMNPGHEPAVMSSTTRDNYVFEWNITHNLNKMADKCGLYKAMWRPEELSIDKAGDLVRPLQEGLDLLKGNRRHFEAYNPPNGWGNYDGLVAFAEAYLEACMAHPEAEIIVSR